MVVYMFGGLLIPDTCPFPADGSREARFWVGVCINFVLGFFLKLSACAIQQKLIGGQLGTNITVRQLCRVHTPEMRTVESVLKQPGLSVGKVAILCGGPDWPTSVLCGIMGLSLWSCEVGTTPIIFYIIPCALCGSAYLRASESAEWEATASAMVFATTIITGLLWVIMAWAVQREWEQKGEELGKPLRQHGDLWFLDHKADTLQKRCAVGWNELPRTLRNCFAAGALIQIVANWCLVQAYYYLFGDFTVSEDWENIEWYAGTMDQCGCYAASGTVERDYCVFAAGGIAVTVIYGPPDLLGWMPYKALYRYWARRNVQIKEEIDQELDEEYQRRWSVAFFQVGHLGEDVDVAMAALALQERARRQLRGAARAGQLLPAVRRVLEASRGPVEEPDGGEGERGPVAVSAAPKRQWADPEHGAARSLEQLDRRLDGQGARAKMFPLLHWCSLCNSSGSFIEFGEGEASPQNQVAERDVSRDFPV
ncbi:unnamed protein product [Prorocentrum cordatum]|uniref:Uncharacterized protein n=1 Tax=Prorocentrum cordatum TaxID=2364126 RepID=A0ABN9XTY1_9DINO|nr:unnamed protein product [Polarella glacialis]